MKLDDIPNLKGSRYPARITVPLSKDTKEKLDALKRKRKDTAELVRRLIDEFFRKNPESEFDTSA